MTSYEMVILKIKKDVSNRTDIKGADPGSRLTEKNILLHLEPTLNSVARALICL